MIRLANAISMTVAATMWWALAALAGLPAQHQLREFRPLWFAIAASVTALSVLHWINYATWRARHKRQALWPADTSKG